jgi:hypothetical protein
MHMQARRDTVLVVFHGTWTIIVNGKKFGPYEGEEEAVLSKSLGRESGGRGRNVGVLIDCDRVLSGTLH